MTVEQSKIELIQWIAGLNQQEWLNKILALKQSLETKPDLHPVQEIRNPRQRGLGFYEGKIWMSDDFDEPLEDFKDYM